MAIKASTATVTTDKANTLVVVAASTFQGRDVVDIRNYFHNEVGELIPTKRGISVSPEVAVEIYYALEEILKNAELI